MSQAFANVDGVSLFACTKCNSRHHFEDLSQGHQLCKDCKGSFQVVKCNYCRSEYQQEGGGKPSSICKKCEQLQEQHGKPGLCAYCNIIAAFIGTKCQRCTNSEKKYGPPMSCEHCRQKCAFDRKDPESKKKVDGKILCWLCTLAYKRTLAKARKKEAILNSSLGSGSHHRLSGPGESKSYTSSLTRHQSGSNGQRHSGSTSSNFNPAGGSKSSSYHQSNRQSSSSSHRHSQQNSSSSSNFNHRESSSSSSSNKKQRLDLSSSSNGHLTSNMSTMSSSLSDTRFIDPNNSSDLATVVAQLKDQISLLNKRLQMKEKDLLSKDQQIADLKSTSAREQRELREKITSLQKQHTERISEMQAKMKAMQKQIASQTKTTKTNHTSGFVKPPLVI